MVGGAQALHTGPCPLTTTSLGSMRQACHLDVTPIYDQSVLQEGLCTSCGPSRSHARLQDLALARSACTEEGDSIGGVVGGLLVVD
jgi:hypothetical protein